MSGRVVLVTGGARGIGLACARQFAARGDRVAVTHLTSPPPEPELGIELAVVCDVTSSASVDAAFEQVERELGPVDVVVSNAGIGPINMLMRATDEQIDSVLDANLAGAIRVARRAAQTMTRQRSGRIVFVGSVSATWGAAGSSIYAASKAGLIGLARSLARELGARGITVNVVAPGAIDTDMLAGAAKAIQETGLAQAPLRRAGTPDEVAAAVVFLGSPEASYITGAVLPVDGGLAMGS